MDAEHVSHAVLIGNSLGGPVAIEAALLAPTRVLAVIGIDTPEHAQKTTEAWRNDPQGSMDQMLRMLLHIDLDAALYEDIRRRMSRCAMFRSFGGYDLAGAVAKLRVPLRCINGNKFPINFEELRCVVPGFEPVVLPHIGHYPMLECPDEFNRVLGVTPSVPVA